MLKKHKSGVIGLVVPEPLASVVREFLGDGDLGDLWRATCDHGRWRVIEIPGKNGTVNVTKSESELRQAQAKEASAPVVRPAAKNGKTANGHAHIAVPPTPNVGDNLQVAQTVAPVEVR